MKFLMPIVHKNDNISIPSPVKDKPEKVLGLGGCTIADLIFNSQSQWPSSRFNDAGSQDEAFFDSQPWLESDCEDDYYSVKGDFTPSRGSTPVHHNVHLGNLQVSKAPSTEGKPSPPDKRKRLSELFKENFVLDSGEEDAADKKNEAAARVVPEPANLVHQPKSSSGTPSSLSEVNSRRGSVRTPNTVLRAEEKSVKAQCCLPRLLSGHRFKEKKKGMSPARTTG